MTEAYFYRAEMAAAFVKYNEFYDKSVLFKKYQLLKFNKKFLLVDRHKASFKYLQAANDTSHNLITLFMETIFTGYLIASVGQDLINVSFCYSTGRLHDPTCFYIPYKIM